MGTAAGAVLSPFIALAGSFKGNSILGKLAYAAGAAGITTSAGAIIGTIGGLLEYTRNSNVQKFTSCNMKTIYVKVKDLLGNSGGSLGEREHHLGCLVMDDKPENNDLTLTVENGNCIMYINNTSRDFMKLMNESLDTICSFNRKASYESVKTKNGKYFVTLTGVTIDNVVEEIIANTIASTDNNGNLNDYTVNCLSESLLKKYRK